MYRRYSQRGAGGKIMDDAIEQAYDEVEMSKSMLDEALENGDPMEIENTLSMVEFSVKMVKDLGEQVSKEGSPDQVDRIAEVVDSSVKLGLEAKKAAKNNITGDQIMEDVSAVAKEVVETADMEGMSGGGIRKLRYLVGGASF